MLVTEPEEPVQRDDRLLVCQPQMLSANTSKNSFQRRQPATM